MKARRDTDIAPHRLHDLLEYVPETGEFFWKRRADDCGRFNSLWVGKPALRNQLVSGYMTGQILNQKYLAHRVAFAMMVGRWPDMIDHINGDRTDNRWCNLREVDSVGNARNMAIRSDNKTGVMGIAYNKNRFQVTVGVRGARSKYVGRYKTLEEAKAAREQAMREHGYHENHGRAQA